MIAGKIVPLPVEEIRRRNQTERVETWGPQIIVALSSLLFAAVFAWLSLERHWAFESHAFDLGNMDQAVWNTLHGHFLRFTDQGIGRPVLTSRLAIHVEPFLLAFVPLYRIHAGPETLLLAQAVVVGIGAIPAYLLARDVLGWRWLSLVFPFAYLAHPSLQNAVLDDFHAVVLSACFLMWMILFLYRGQMWGFAAAAALAMGTKEEIGLLVAMAGIGLLIQRKHPIAGAVAVLAGTSWFLTCVVVIIPHFDPLGHSPYLYRYAYLGHSVGGVIKGIVLHPGLVVETLASHARLNYLFALLGPLAFVSVLGLPILLLASPSLLINMLSSDAHMYSAQYQYSAEIVPYIIGAAILGVNLARRFSVRSGRFLCLLVMAAALAATRLYGFSPVAEGYVVPSSGLHERIEDRLLGAIPAGAPVSAADEIEPHITNRLWAYLLPRIHASNGPYARYIVLDASVPSSPYTPITLRRAAAWALWFGYGVQAADDGVLVLKKGGASKTLPPSFYSFLFRPWQPAIRETAHWGPLRLTGVTVHPQGSRLTASRPNMTAEMFWKSSHRLRSRARITVYLSPPFRGKHPGFSGAWRAQHDSSAWDWLPLTAWPVGRVVRAESVPLVARTDSIGQVDVAIGVTGVGPLRGIAASARVSGAPSLLRVATLTTGY